MEEVTHHLLVPPDPVSASGSLTTFCEVSVGSRVFAMKGERRLLVERAGRVAEGVETIEELDYLRTHTRIGVAQGYCFSRPEFIDTLCRRREHAGG